MRVVVTGANRGIGLEFVEQLLARGDQVEAAVRALPEEISFETPMSEKDAATDPNLYEEARKVLATLTPREQEVLRLRFGTLEDADQDFPATRERIRQIEAKALLKLRHASGSNPLRDAAGELNRLQSEKSGLRVHRCDVSSDEQVAAFAESIGRDPVDLLINNAGVGWQSTLESVRLEDMMQTININALGPFRVTRALLRQLRASSAAKIVHVSSGMGSIAQNTGGGAYSYRMSKAALNMMSRSLAADLRAEKIISVAISPGWVQTDMGGQGAPVSPADSVRGMLKVIDRLTLAQSGAFLSFEGNEVPW